MTTPQYGEWQDIGTAPRDGTEVLAFDPDVGVCAVLFWDEEGGWVSSWAGDVTYNQILVEPIVCSPTHWMPLPPPPAEKGA